MNILRLAAALLLLLPPQLALSQSSSSADAPLVTANDEFDWRQPRSWTRPLLYETNLPFNDSGLDYSLPPIRYNRTEGLVLGVSARELDADDWQRAKPVGTLSYAFALGEWRYDAGLEVRPFADFPSLAGTKVGVRYRFNTTTDDAWKAPSGENSLAALFFRNDFYDYYEVQGWSVYAMQPLGRRIQVSVGYRSEEHRTLENETSWSVFRDGSFRANPAITPGMARSIVAALEAGLVRHRLDRPYGNALRIEYEVAPDALGSDLSYSRFTVDARTYGRLTPHTTYAARLRGGLADPDGVVQKQFTLGGVGSVRGYPLNLIRADRLVLANLEYGLSEVDLILDDLDLFGFADAAWTSSNFLDQRDEEILASAGLGVGFAGRKVRLELAFPLNDVGTGMEPSLWFRLYPQF